MAKRSIKDHPFYLRMKQLPPGEVAAWVLGDLPIEEADKSTRHEAFRRIAKNIAQGKAERAKHGYNSDTNGETARALEWAFQAGGRAAARPGGGSTYDCGVAAGLGVALHGILKADLPTLALEIAEAAGLSVAELRRGGVRESDIRRLAKAGLSSSRKTAREDS
jgi:hypothetical protein